MRHHLHTIQLAFGALVTTTLVGCKPAAPTRPGMYEACGVCFESNEPLSPVRGLKVDSCAFQFKGDGLIVRGEHSGFAGEPAEHQRERALPGGGWRTRGRSADSGNPSIGVWLPEEGGAPPLKLRVEYVDAAATAAQIVSSAHRCGVPPE